MILTEFLHCRSNGLHRLHQCNRLGQEVRYTHVADVDHLPEVDAHAADTTNCAVPTTIRSPPARYTC